MGIYKGARVALTLDQDIYSLLEQWASRQRIPIASFAKSILEKEILAAQLRGDCGDSNSVADTAPYIAYIKAIAGIGSIDPLDLQKLADSLGVDSTVLALKLKECLQCN